MNHSNVKERIVTYLLIFTILFSLVPTGDMEVAAATARFKKTAINVKVGKTGMVKVTGKKIKVISWKTTNKKVVTVKKKGSKSATITGKKTGTARIKAKVTFSSKKKKTISCKVTVINKETTAEKNASVTQLTATTETPNTIQGGAITTFPTLKPSDAGPTTIPTLQPFDTISKDELAVCAYPMLFTDMPDVYMCRKEDTYYMISTTMFLNPGAPIVKSTDLVHWQLAGYVYDTLVDDDYANMDNGKDMYSNGQWASALAYDEENDLFVVCFNTNNQGSFFFTTNNIESGEWKKYKAKNASYHDPGLLFEDGKMYVFATYGQCDMSQVELVDDTDGDGIGEAIRVENYGTIIKSTKFSGTEGWHAYHIGEYYYLIAIGSPIRRWFRTQIAYRSKDLFSKDWEEQVIYSGPSGGFNNQGLAQGGLIDTVYGDWYAYAFQDHESIGRCPSVVEVNWDYTDAEIGRAHV